MEITTKNIKSLLNALNAEIGDLLCSLYERWEEEKNMKVSLNIKTR